MTELSIAQLATMNESQIVALSWSTEWMYETETRPD